MGVQQPVLRDLQTLLRRSLGMPELLVEKVTSGSLLPPGENYGSSIVKVRALVKSDSQQQAPEEWHLIAKMLPPTEFQRVVFDCNYTVPKEVFLYEQLFPAYQQLEREFGVERVFDVLPKFFGARLSLDETAREVDEDAVILLENLKERGFYLANRKKGLDLEHAKVAVKALAHFHVLGMAMKCHKPDRFELFKFRAKCMTPQKNEFDSVMAKIMSKIEEDPTLAEYVEVCRVALMDTSMSAWTNLPEEPWSTIVHSDFWVNNFLFHKDSSGKVDDIKFVDFQNYLFQSPLRELAFLLGVSLEVEVEKDHFYELVDLYYEEFIHWLTKLKCDTTQFNREAFDKQLAHDGNIEFMHCTFMLKILTTDVDKDADMSQIKDLMLMEGNGDYKERLSLLVRSFAKRGWL